MLYSTSILIFFASFFSPLLSLFSIILFLFLTFSLFFLLFFSRWHYVAQVSFKLSILLLQPLKYLDYRCTQTLLVSPISYKDISCMIVPPVISLNVNCPLNSFFSEFSHSKGNGFNIWLWVQSINRLLKRDRYKAVHF